MTTAVVWFRRDLRLGDHPALLAARDAAGPDGDVLPVFVFDERLYGPSGEPRRRFLLDCLAALDGDLDGALVLRSGNPAEVLPALVREGRVFLAHIGGMDQRPTALQPGGNLAELVFGPRDQHDIRPLLPEAARGGSTDAGTGAGDDDGLSFEA